MEKERWNGQTAASIQVNSCETGHAVKGLYIIATGTSTKASGKTTRPTAWVYISRPKELGRQI